MSFIDREDICCIYGNTSPGFDNNYFKIKQLSSAFIPPHNIFNRWFCLKAATEDNISHDFIEWPCVVHPCPPLILTALSDRESVCKMSNMVFNTRPLQSRWGNLVEVKHMKNRIHAVYNMMEKNVGRKSSWIIKTHVSANPDRYLSATLRILLCVWLKLISKNWACRSSSSSCSLVLA